MYRIDSTESVFLEMIDETGMLVWPGVACLECNMFFRLLQMYCQFL